MSLKKKNRISHSVLQPLLKGNPSHRCFNEHYSWTWSVSNRNDIETHLQQHWNWDGASLLFTYCAYLWGNTRNNMHLRCPNMCVCVASERESIRRSIYHPLLFILAIILLMSAVVLPPQKETPALRRSSPSCETASLRSRPHQAEQLFFSLAFSQQWYLHHYICGQRHPAQLNARTITRRSVEQTS